MQKAKKKKKNNKQNKNREIVKLHYNVTAF